MNITKKDIRREMLQSRFSTWDIIRISIDNDLPIRDTILMLMYSRAFPGLKGTESTIDLFQKIVQDDVDSMVSSQRQIDGQRRRNQEEIDRRLMQMQYTVGDKVVIQHDIEEGTIAGGWEYTEGAGQVITIVGRYVILDADERIKSKGFGDYYITEELGPDVYITDAMVDQMRSKDISQPPNPIEDINDEIAKHIERFKREVR